MMAGLGALEDDDTFRKNCQTIMETREWTIGKLRQIGFAVTDSMTNFVFARHESIPGETVHAYLRRNGILVRRFDTPRLRDYNRITIGSRQEMQALVETLEGEIR